MNDTDSKELANFEVLTKATIPLPGEIPKLKGIDIYGESIQSSGSLGGDHIIYIDFKHRYNLDEKIAETQLEKRFTVKSRNAIIKNIQALKNKGGILIADVSGHFQTDFSFAARLHDAFLTGVMYEIEERGDVTANLFRKLNTRLYNSSSFDKFITMIYGEISELGDFKFISAGHPFPLVYSPAEKKLRQFPHRNLKRSPPLAAFPSQGLDIERNYTQAGYCSKFAVNQMPRLASGEILLLYTDGISELESKSKRPYYEPKTGGRLHNVLEKNHHLSAQELFRNIQEDIFEFAHPQDDLSYIIIKKH